MPETENKKQDVKYIVRILNTDLNGSLKISHSLLKIKGLGFMLINAILNIAEIDQNKKTGLLDENEIKKINDILKNPLKYSIPIWMLNRRKDYETGNDVHLYTSDLDFVKMNDIKMMQKMKSYKGVRHGFGLPVRGQKTKSNFRRGKSLGVAKKANKK